MSTNRTVFVDVDDTLVRTYGAKQIPIPASIKLVRRMHDAGDQLYCWSRGGAEYAKKVADMLEITECFIEFLPKPDVLLDDQGTNALGHCDIIHPSNAPNY